MLKPKEGTAPGTLHELAGFMNEKSIFKWTGKGWTVPGIEEWMTPPGAMRALGWRYVGPVNETKDSP